jgi:hypothetical protein
MDLPSLCASNHSSRTLIARLLDRKYWQKYQLRSAVIRGCGERQRRSCRETITCHEAQHRRHSKKHPHVVTSVTFYSLQQAKHRIAYVARLKVCPKRYAWTLNLCLKEDG